MGRIAVLSEGLINKIAAGEVVERPASAIKELCENSIDASARTLRIWLKDGGLSGISVVDDGHGMSREDAVLSLSRHATSKLKDLDGLFAIATKGFRGEAVPAIAAVSRFTLTTSEPGAAVGTRLTLEGGNKLEVADAAPLGGTRIDVDDLFFNTPARRKFMKREQTELSHCEEAVVRLALAHPEVAFFVDHAGKPMLASPACENDPRERIAAALGSEVHPHLLEVDERQLGVHVHGYIASPEFTLPTARGIYAFVNRRYVRDRGLNHAIGRAFRDSLPPGRQPVAVLFIDIEPHAVDVNVHPQKMEVRFADPRGIYETVVGALMKALRTSPWLNASAPQSEAVAGAHYAQAVDRFLARAQDAGSFVEAERLPFIGEQPATLFDESPLAFGRARPGINEAPPPGYFSSLRWLGTFGRRFFACEGPGGTLVVIDPHAALERVRLSELRQELARGPAARGQRFLFASTVELPVSEARALVGRLETLEQLGLELEPFGGTTFALKSVPPMLVGADYRKLLCDLAATLPPAGTELTDAALHSALKVLACHAAGQVKRSMTSEQITSLFLALDEADFELSCAHPQVVLHEVPLLTLEARAR